MRRLGSLVIALLAALPLAFVGTTTAVSAPTCSGHSSAAPVKIAQLPDWAESMIVDQRGRMFVTTNIAGRVYRIDRPGAEPTPITGSIGATGGIVVRPDGKLLVGTGNDLVHSTTGDLFPVSKILLVDPDTGAVSPYAEGLGGIDGMALAPDGTVYTTTLGGRHIGRVSPDGTVDPDWSSVPLGNGIGVSPDGAWVYVIQTTVSPVLYRIPATSGVPQPWVRTSLVDSLGVPDGMTIDGQGRPLVVGHASGQVWRVEDGTYCSISRSPLLSTQVTYGRGTQGFSAGRLFRSGVDGGIYELPAAAR